MATVILALTASFMAPAPIARPAAALAVRWQAPPALPRDAAPIAMLAGETARWAERTKSPAATRPHAHLARVRSNVVVTDMDETLITKKSTGYIIRFLVMCKRRGLSQWRVVAGTARARC